MASDEFLVRRIKPVYEKLVYDGNAPKNQVLIHLRHSGLYMDSESIISRHILTINSIDC